MSTESLRPSPSRQRARALWLLGLLVLTLALVGTVVMMGGRVEAATWGLVVAAAALVFTLHALYRMATSVAARVLRSMAGSKGRLASLPFAGGWTKHRDFPAPQGKTFQQMWADKQKGARS